MNDSVIIKAEETLANAKGKLNSASIRLEKAVKARTRWDGSVREGGILQASKWETEVGVYTQRVKDLEADLQEAIKDLPRRNSVRKQASDLEDQAVQVDEEARALVEKLRDLEKRAMDLRAKSAEAQRQASHTPRQLELQAKRKTEAQDKAKQDARTFRQNEVNVARRMLQEAEEGKAHQELINDRKEDLKYAEEVLARV